jgi:F420-dependent oxidoreductase-like protein
VFAGGNGLERQRRMRQGRRSDGDGDDTGQSERFGQGTAGPGDAELPGPLGRPRRVPSHQGHDFETGGSKSTDVGEAPESGPDDDDTGSPSSVGTPGARHRTTLSSTAHPDRRPTLMADEEATPGTAPAPMSGQARPLVVHDGGMRLRLFVEPQQGATYDDQLGIARCGEEEGFDAIFRSDHYLRMGNGDGIPGPTDAWTTLAGLARETTSIRLGTLVSSGTFRLPGPLAITVAQVDAMSGGRVELGLGAGWYEDEHRAYAIPFPPLKERFERLEEELTVITGLWETPSGETFDFDGRFFQVTNSPCLPKPIQQPRPPIIVGGGGAKRTPALAARFADEFNTPFLSPADAAQQYARVDEACDGIGRDPRSIRHTAALIVCCGEDDDTVAHRAKAIGWSVDDLKRYGACGSPDDVAGRIREWEAAGATTAYLQIMDMSDLDHVRLIGREVMPLLA